MTRIRSGRTRAFGVMTVASLAVMLLGVAPAGASGATVVRGEQGPPVADCNGEESLGTYEMTGDLVGCWYTDTFENPHNGVNTSTFTGTEHFTGCIDTSGDGTCTTEGTGTFSTTFVFIAKFVDGREVHGHCHHPIVAGSGTGVFEGATGSVSFHDVVTPDLVTATYQGSITV